MEITRESMPQLLEGAKESAGLLMGIGVLTVIVGLISLVWPWASGAAVVMVIGLAMFVGGVARLVGAFTMGSFGRGTLAFIGGTLTLLAGLLLIVRPDVGLATLTLLLGAYLLVDGIFGAVFAFQVRPEKGWGWILFSAAVSFLLGILLMKEWPLSGVWAIGTMVGISLLFSGITMISISSAARKFVKAVKGV